MISINLSCGLRAAVRATTLTILATAYFSPLQAAAQVPDVPPVHDPEYLLGNVPQFVGSAECTNGFANGFPCENVDLLAIVPSFELSYHLCQLLNPLENPISPPLEGGDQGLTPMTGSDMWGWTTEDEDGNVREFALQGLSDAVAFIEMTDPADPKFLGCLTAPTRNFLWRDLKIYNDHMYVVGDFSPELAIIPHDHDSGAEHVEHFVHGLQIFDLKQLLTADPNAPQRFLEDNIYGGFDEAHNIVINEENGFAAAVASDTCGTEFHMLDLSKNPLHPEFLGCFNSGLPGAVHDAQCVTYQGPDVEHHGKEICLAFMEDQFSIFDMSDPDNVVALATNLSYEGWSYVHQGWFTDDHQYVASNDETDELDSTSAAALSPDPTDTPHGTRTYVWDVKDLDNPVFVAHFESTSMAIDHNMYFKGDYLHQANYTSGYRVLKFDPSALIPDVSAGLTPVAFFDTNPPDADVAAFGGVWSGYFHFESGAVALSQLNNGELFILQPHLPEEPPVDDDDHDSDDIRDDEDSDDDNDGKSDDSDSDDDNDGKKDDDDSDDDNDGIGDDYDSQSSKDKMHKSNGMAAAGQSKSSTITAGADTLLLIAAAESASADMLRVEIRDPNGMLVATSVSALGRAVATSVPLASGEYTVTVTNQGTKTAHYTLVTVGQEAW